SARLRVFSGGCSISLSPAPNNTSISGAFFRAILSASCLTRKNDSPSCKRWLVTVPREHERARSLKGDASMKSCVLWFAILPAFLLPFALIGRGDNAKEAGTIASFRMEEIETKLGVGYAVLLVDVNGDGKKDIV